MVKIKYTSCRAKLISDRVGGDFVRIETVQTYPTKYNELAVFLKIKDIIISNQNKNI